MPRSGSTLLQNLLAQDPRFYCSPTSGLIGLLLASRQVFTNAPEFKATDEETNRKAFQGYCRRAIHGFYSGVADETKAVVVDKSRGWLHQWDWLKLFWPEKPKLIICIRDLRGCLSSMEKLYRLRMDYMDPAANPEQMGMVTIDSRVRQWLNTVPLGVTAGRLSDLVKRGIHKECCIVRFEDLHSNPAPTMRRVYEYLEEPCPEIDFEHVEQRTRENDHVHGIYGVHQIRSKVEAVKPDWNEVLGKDIAQNIVAGNQWFYREFYPNVLNHPVGEVTAGNGDAGPALTRMSPQQFESLVKRMEMQDA
jgi:sulfotransferase